MVNASDTLFSALQVWVDRNNDGVTDAGELHSLHDLGITQFNLDAHKTAELNHGNLIGLNGSFETSDGQSHTLADVWFRTDGNGAQSIDLTQLDPQAVGAHALGHLDLAADGGQATTLTVDAAAVAALGQAGQVDAGNGAAAPVQMIVDGNANDTLNVTGDAGQWQAAGTTEVNGANYNVFNDGDVQLLVATDVQTWIH